MSLHRARRNWVIKHSSVRDVSMIQYTMFIAQSFEWWKLVLPLQKRRKKEKQIKLPCRGILSDNENSNQLSYHLWPSDHLASQVRRSRANDQDSHHAASHHLMFTKIYDISLITGFTVTLISCYHYSNCFINIHPGAHFPQGQWFWPQVDLVSTYGIGACTSSRNGWGRGLHKHVSKSK